MGEELNKKDGTEKLLENKGEIILGNEEYYDMAELMKEFFDEAMKNLENRIEQTNEGKPSSERN